MSDLDEFQIVPKYRGRPLAYLRLKKSVEYNEVKLDLMIWLIQNFKETNNKRDMTVEYYVNDRKSGSTLYKELIHLHVFISEYDFWTLA